MNADVQKQRLEILYDDNEISSKDFISEYYKLDKKYRNLDDVRENLKNYFIENESFLENNDEPFAKEGLREMYNYIHSEDINYRFDIYTLLEIHRKLYSKAPYPEVGGTIRNATAHLNNVAIDIAPHYEIRNCLNNLDYEVQAIVKLGEEVKQDYSKIFEYIDRCVKLKCDLIKTHPFIDGNKRSVRGFINKLFLNVNLPSVCLIAPEHKIYREALEEAIGEGNYDKIKNFYYYKICDAIYELDINQKSNNKSLSKRRVYESSK